MATSEVRQVESPSTDALTVPLYAALARGLADHGIDTVFGLIGDANVLMVDAFARQEAKTYVSAAHEAGAVLMACGYAQRSGRLGVATTTNGPGVTNTVTALTEAVHARVPLLVVVGDSPRAVRRFSPQEICERDVVRGAGAGFESADSPQTALADLAMAIRRAHLERRPVVLSVPNDFMNQRIEYRHVSTGLIEGRPVVPAPEALQHAVQMLASAQRPVVLLGRGVHADARPAVLALAERIGAPTATTLGGKGQIKGQRFSLGIFGIVSTPMANEVIASADCIVAFGASLNAFTTAGGSMLKDKVIIHCDIDPARIGLHVAVDAPVVGDAGSTATALIALLDQAQIPPTGFRSPALADRLSQSAPTADHSQLSADSPIDIRTALARLNIVLPEARTVVVDGGRFMEQAWQLIDAPSPQAWRYAIAFGAIGLSVGTAIGAGVAAPGEPVVCVCGDGGFMTGGITEFNTAVRHDIDLITIVCNDGAYGAEFGQLRNAGSDPGIGRFDWPDLAPVADALGGRGVTVATVADLELAERAIRERDRPLLIDVKLDPDDIPQLNIAGR